jgi:predicted GTPase
MWLSADVRACVVVAEGNTPKEDLIKLILKNTKWPEPSQEPEPEPEPEMEPPPPLSEDERTDDAADEAVSAPAAAASGDEASGRSTAQHVWELLGECRVQPRPIERPADPAAASTAPPPAVTEAAPFLAGLGEGSIGGAPLCVSIGVVGEPNLGKSSLINALFGSRVVSRSSTPGHTKHLQSLYLNRSTAVIDCPGVIFPRCDVPPGLQVLLGSIP